MFELVNTTGQDRAKKLKKVVGYIWINQIKFKFFVGVTVTAVRPLTAQKHSERLPPDWHKKLAFGILTGANLADTKKTIRTKALQLMESNKHNGTSKSVAPCR